MTLLDEGLAQVHQYKGYWWVLPIVYVFYYLLKNKYLGGLNRFPGPALAPFSDWYRLAIAVEQDTHNRYMNWHRTYGDIVRIGPRTLSFASPVAMREIYGHSHGYIKSNFYLTHQTLSSGKRHPSLFSTIDEGYHAKLRRAVSHAFAMSTIVGYEPLMDSTLTAFVNQTKKVYADTGDTCTLSTWCQYAAFDLIGELSWSKRLGFIDNAADVDGTIDKISASFLYAQIAGQQPWLDDLIDKNPVKRFLGSTGLWNTDDPIATFAKSRAAEREALDKDASADGDETQFAGYDMLSRFRESQRQNPEFMTDQMLLATQISLIMAGSDTTSIILGAVFHFLIKHPRVYAKLMEEIDAAVQDGTIQPHPANCVSWAASQKMPYLDACISEAMRLHTPVGAMLERIVPPGGKTITGEFVPEGTMVGCSGWVLHRRPEVFGEDAENYRPERWIESPKKQYNDMKGTLFTFGYGHRTCIGKNISIAEIYKLVPTFLRHFEIAFADPNKDWHTSTHFLVKQEEFYVKIKNRDPKRIQAGVSS